MFITFEGIDGTGKTTFAKYAVKYLESKGFQAVYTQEPTNDLLDIKQIVEKRLDPFTQILLYTADRIEHVKKIKKFLQEKKIVICDRYVDSTFAYQGSLIEPLFGNRAKSYRYLTRLYEPFKFEPDLVILFTVDPDLGMGRVQNRIAREVFENIEFLKKVQDYYLFMSKQRKYIIIDSNRAVDPVWDDVKKVLDSKVSKHLSLKKEIK